MRIKNNLPYTDQFLKLVNPSLYFATLPPNEIEMVKSIIFWAIFGLICAFILKNLFFPEYQRVDLLQTESKLISRGVHFLVVELLSIPLISVLTTPRCNQANTNFFSRSDQIGDNNGCKSSKSSSLGSFTELIQMIFTIFIIVLLKRLNFDYRLKGKLFGTK